MASNNYKPFNFGREIGPLSPTSRPLFSGKIVRIGRRPGTPLEPGGTFPIFGGNLVGDADWHPAGFGTEYGREFGDDPFGGWYGDEIGGGSSRGGGGLPGGGTGHGSGQGGFIRPIRYGESRPNRLPPYSWLEKSPVPYDAEIDFGPPYGVVRFEMLEQIPDWIKVMIMEAGQMLADAKSTWPFWAQCLDQIDSDLLDCLLEQYRTTKIGIFKKDQGASNDFDAYNWAGKQPRWLMINEKMFSSLSSTDTGEVLKLLIHELTHGCGMTEFEAQVMEHICFGSRKIIWSDRFGLFRESAYKTQIEFYGGRAQRLYYYKYFIWNPCTGEIWFLRNGEKDGNPYKEFAFQDPNAPALGDC